MSNFKKLFFETEVSETILVLIKPESAQLILKTRPYNTYYDCYSFDEWDQEESFCTNDTNLTAYKLKTYWGDQLPFSTDEICREFGIELGLPEQELQFPEFDKYIPYLNSNDHIRSFDVITAPLINSWDGHKFKEFKRIIKNVDLETFNYNLQKSIVDLEQIQKIAQEKIGYYIARYTDLYLVAEINNLKVFYNRSTGICTFGRIKKSKKGDIIAESDGYGFFPASFTEKIII